MAVPTDPCRGTTAANRYNPISNPGGVRCTIQDAAINVFGPDPKRLWSPVEQELGRGFVRIPVDNVGVLYGLGALKAGQITPAEFVDLNAKAGGLDIDANPMPDRIDNAGAPSLARAYRAGMINEANNLNRTAIIDCRGPNPGLFHDAYRAFAVRARLDREHGTHANQLIWEGPVPLVSRQRLRGQQLHCDGPLAQRRGKRPQSHGLAAEADPRQARRSQRSSAGTARETSSPTASAQPAW